jgi:hypothetical protein
MRQRIFPPVDKSTLKEIKKQFEIWRNTRKCRGPIPGRLWKAAISLSGNYSINHISRTLRLNYRELKRRVEVLNEEKSSGGSLSEQFIEVSIPEPIPAIECTLEMEDDTGARMKMHIKGRVNFEELVRSFWEKRR